MFPKLDFIGWEIQQGNVKSVVEPNRNPSILQMLMPMTTMHCCHCNDDWEGHYHYVDAASDANPWVVTRQSLIQYQNFCRLSLFSWKIASSQKCRKFCHQVQLTNLEGRDFCKYITLLHLLQYILDIWAFPVPFLWHRVHYSDILIFGSTVRSLLHWISQIHLNSKFLADPRQLYGSHCYWLTG